ncbi:hypothetical protein MBLNU13_g10785t1 [Cladosporium sp. NU13]
MQSQTCTHLVLVCCHATFRGGSPDDELSWILQPFQQSDTATGKVGEHHTFMQHIAAGTSILAKDPGALLLFSGGKTQTQVNTTEAESYQRVSSIMNNWQNHPLDDSSLAARCDVETHATDSFQNLLFSILRFKHLIGTYPTQVTVVTHAFKELRFLELHAPAIKFPASGLRVFGINPPMTLEELQDVQDGERKRGYDPFVKDPYGAGELLAKKRIARGWDTGAIEKPTSGLEHEVKRLLEWKGGASGKETFNQRLPWECH